LKNTKAYIIMLNDEPKLTIIGSRATAVPILSKMRTAHLKETMGDMSASSRTAYHNTFTWHITITDCVLIKELKVERGKNRVDRR
jgi:hypothetical protein